MLAGRVFVLFCLDGCLKASKPLKASPMDSSNFTSKPVLPENNTKIYFYNIAWGKAHEMHETDRENTAYTLPNCA